MLKFLRTNNLFSNALVLLISLALTSVIFFYIQSLYKPRGHPIASGWQITKASDQFIIIGAVQLPFYQIIEKPGSIILENRLDAVEGDRLVLPRISGTYLELYINGKRINELGSPDLTGNIWPHFHSIRIPDLQKESEVHIKIKLAGLYDLGIRELPYFIKTEEHRFFLFCASVFLNNIYWAGVGACFTLSAFLLLFAAIESSLRTVFIFISIADFAAVFYMLDFIPRETSGSIADFIMLRKVFLSMACFSSFIMLPGIELLIKKKIRHSWYMLVGTGICITALLIQSDLHGLKKISTITSSIAQVNWIIILILVMRFKDRLLVLGWSFFIMTVVFSTINLMIFKNHIFLFHIGMIAGQLVIGLQLIHRYRTIQSDLKTAVHKSRLDPLTGAFNRYMLEELACLPGDRIALIDLNDFKQVNDAHGHALGDRVLINLVESIRECTRQNDTIIRMGGDEFLIHFGQIPAEHIQPILLRIRNSLTAKNQTIQIGFDWGTAQIKSNLDAAIDFADQNLYDMKKLDS